MRHAIQRKLAKLGVLICSILLGLAACEDQPDEPTGLEVEEREVERDDGQIEEAEIELEREELDDIDRPADEELVEALEKEEPEAQEDETAQQQQDQQQPEADEQEQDLTAVFAAPIDFVGLTASGEATVADVVTDRGFWLTGDDDNRLFAIVREYDERIDINEGQRIRVRGTLIAPGDPTDVAGPLDPETQRLAEEQDAFLVAHWRDIEILDEADDGAVGGGPDEKEKQKEPQPDQ